MMPPTGSAPTVSTSWSTLPGTLLAAGPWSLPGDLPLLPARMINEYQYCPRLSYLEWVQGEWADSVDTVQGRYAHRRVDRPSGDLPAPGEEAESAHARSITLSSSMCSTTRASSRATWRISSSLRPRVVAAGLPRRIPDGSNAERLSPGTIFALSVILARSSACCACLPGTPCLLRSTRSR